MLGHDVDVKVGHEKPNASQQVHHYSVFACSLIDGGHQGRREGRGQLGHFVLGPKRSIYSNRTVKCSIKAVTTYILPWALQALSAALAVTKLRLLHCSNNVFFPGRGPIPQWPGQSEQVP